MFDIFCGEILGFVGEFGCGKLMIGRMIICLYDVISGEVLFNGENVYGCKLCLEFKKFNCKM